MLKKTNKLIGYKKGHDFLYDTIIKRKDIPAEQMYEFIKGMLIIDPNKRSDIQTIKNNLNLI